MSSIHYSEFLKFSTYRDIFNLLYHRDYIYFNLIMKTLNDNPKKHINKLINHGIIEESCLTDKEKEELRFQDGVNEYNIGIMKIYRWTKKSLQYFNLNSVKDFIINKIRIKVVDKIKQFNNKVKQWRDKLNKQNEYKSKLMSINFDYILEKSKFYGDLSYFDIKNAYDFMSFSLRHIAKITRLTKSTLETIEKNILEELGGFRNVL